MEIQTEKSVAQVAQVVEILDRMVRLVKVRLVVILVTALHRQAAAPAAQQLRPVVTDPPVLRARAVSVVKTEQPVPARPAL